MLDDALRRKRCESLLEKGRALIEEGEFDAALEIAAELEELGNCGGFELAALAQAGKGDLEAAVATLQRGVAVAPEVWLLWVLLGNHLGELRRYDDAEAAYHRALACPGCSPDPVRLNLAIVARQRHRPEIALELLDGLRDPAVLGHEREVRVSTLFDLGRQQEALALAESFLEGGAPEDKDGAARWDRVAAAAASIRMSLSHEPADVRRWILDRLSEARASPALLRALRELDGKRSPAARRFDIIVHGAVSLRGPDNRRVPGFFTRYLVAAETPEHGLELIRELEQLPGDEPANLSIKTVEDLGPAADEPLGVAFRLGRMYYGEDD